MVPLDEQRQAVAGLADPCRRLEKPVRTRGDWKPGVALNKLHQTSSVGAYIAAFEDLATSTRGWTTEILLDRFMAGLKEEIHLELVMLDPPTFRVVIGMARVAEQKLRDRTVTFRPVMTKSFSPNHGVTPMQASSTRPPGPGETLPYKKLTIAEMAARREKGLCYNCDERFAPGHNCKPQFQCIVLEDSPFEEECPALEVGECVEEVIEMEEPGEAKPTPNISCHALEGRFVPSTLRLKGVLQGLGVTVLVDNGSTHNFLQTRVACKVGLAIEPSRHLNVTIGNGDELQCEGTSSDTSYVSQSIPCTILPIGHA